MYCLLRMDDDHCVVKSKSEIVMKTANTFFVDHKDCQRVATLIARGPLDRLSTLMEKMNGPSSGAHEETAESNASEHERIGESQQSEDVLKYVERPVLEETEKNQDTLLKGIKSNDNDEYLHSDNDHSPWNDGLSGVGKENIDPNGNDENLPSAYKGQITDSNNFDEIAESDTSQSQHTDSPPEEEKNSTPVIGSVLPIFADEEIQASDNEEVAVDEDENGQSTVSAAEKQFQEDLQGKVMEESVVSSDNEQHNSDGIIKDILIDGSKKRRSLQELLEEEFPELATAVDESPKTPKSFEEIMDHLNDPELDELNDDLGFEDLREESLTNSSLYIDPNELHNLSLPSIPEDAKTSSHDTSTEVPDISLDAEQIERRSEVDGSPVGTEHDESIKIPTHEGDTTWADSDDETNTEDAETTNADTSLDVPENKIIPRTGAIDKRNLTARPGTTKSKSSFCFYCKRELVVISRHMETVHHDEPEVKEFAVLPKGNPIRKEMIKRLRLQGNEIWNTDARYNTTGELKVARRPREERAGTLYKRCGNCRDTFSANTIRRHQQGCIGPSGPGDRSNQFISRLIEGNIHKDASPRLAKIFAVFRENQIIYLIRYDELLIRFGNGLCEKYRKQNQEDLIRNRLRTLGRLLHAMRGIDPSISDFKSIYHPKYYKVMLQAVKQMAGFHDSDEVGEDSCDVPSLVTMIGGYVTAVGDTLKLYWVEKIDDENEKIVDKFLFLHKKQYSQAVNRVALEDQARKHRLKAKPLPSTDDVKKLYDFLVKKRTEAYHALQEKYAYNTWLDLLKFSLISIQVFNRRRAGEIERTTINDVKSTQKIDPEEDAEIYASLTEEQKKTADDYSRFIITGKKSRDVPVLLDTEAENCLSLILSHRKAAKIPAKNPYIFGLPGFRDGRFSYLRACPLMRQYSKECEARHPERLRGTPLRKHVATTCAAENVDENQIVDIANFMGHHEAIHRAHYRQSVVSRDVVGMAKHLKKAVGADRTVHHHVENDGTSAGGTDETGDDRVENDRSSTNASDSDDDNMEQGTSADSRLATSSRGDPSNQRSERTFEEPGRSSSLHSAKNKPRLKRRRVRIVSDTSSDEEDDTISSQPPRRSIKKKSKILKSTNDQSVKKPKKRWTDEEKSVAFGEFGDLIRGNQLPTTTAIRQFLKKNPTFHRTIDQVRTWTSNEKKKWNQGHTF